VIRIRYSKGLWYVSGHREVASNTSLLAALRKFLA
jgi:hypothetical protein